MRDVYRGFIDVVALGLSAKDVIKNDKRTV